MGSLTEMEIETATNCSFVLGVFQGQILFKKRNLTDFIFLSFHGF